jgi:hypothetical protein
MNNEWKRVVVVVAAKSAFLLLRGSFEAISNEEQSQSQDCKLAIMKQPPRSVH